MLSVSGYFKPNELFNENANPETEAYFKANYKSLGKPDIKIYKMYYPTLQHVEREDVDRK